MFRKEDTSELGLPGLTILIVAVVGCTGCVQTKLTAPPRAAMEQLLLSTAADRALTNLDLTTFSNRTVYFSTNYFDAYDGKYALASARDALSRAGARLVDSVYEAEIIVEPRSGALSIDGSESIIGIPTAGVPIPLAGNITIPEVALFKSEKQFSVAKLGLLAYARDSGVHFFSSGPMVGKAFTKYYRFLWVISYTSTDVPEKQKANERKGGEFAEPPAPNRGISR